MTITTKSFNYDHPAYLVRQSETVTLAAGGSVTSYPVVAFAATQAFTASFVVITAGVGATATVVVSKQSGATNTVLGTATLGTSVAGTLVQLGLSATAGGVSLAAGDYIKAVTGADTTVVSAMSIDYQVAPQAVVTA